MRKTDSDGKTWPGRLALAFVALMVEPLTGFRDNGVVKKRVAFTVLRLDSFDNADARLDEIMRERCGRPTFDALVEHVRRKGLPAPDMAEVEARAQGRRGAPRLIASLRAAQATLMARHGDPGHPDVAAISEVIRRNGG
jgi:hypothetical protein